MTAQTEVPAAIADSLTDADGALARLDAALAEIGDGDLHRTRRDGGRTVAQAVSHINMCTILCWGTWSGSGPTPTCVLRSAGPLDVAAVVDMLVVPLVLDGSVVLVRDAGALDLRRIARDEHAIQG